MKIKLGRLTVKVTFETKMKEFGILFGFYKFGKVRGMYIDLSLYYGLQFNFDIKEKVIL